MKTLVTLVLAFSLGACAMSPAFAAKGGNGNGNHGNGNGNGGPIGNPCPPPPTQHDKLVDGNHGFAPAGSPAANVNGSAGCSILKPGNCLK